MQTAIRTPPISVIIPAYGRPLFLRELLESVCTDVESSLVEVIVIDDGSTEPIEPKLAHELTTASVRFGRQVNAGTAAARNSGRLSHAANFCCSLTTTTCSCQVA